MTPRSSAISGRLPSAPRSVCIRSAPGALTHRPTSAVRRVGRDEDRDVANEPDAALVGVALQVVPLAEEEELAELVQANAATEPAPGPLQGRWLPPPQLWFPLQPARPVVRVLQREE